MPLHRRLPKRGFNKYRAEGLQRDQCRRAAEGDRREAARRREARRRLRRWSRPACCAAPKDGLRLLGDGELKAKLDLTVDHASASAVAAVEKAGGSIKLIEKKVLAADEAKRKKSAAKKAAKGGTKKKGGGDEMRHCGVGRLAFRSGRRVPAAVSQQSRLDGGTWHRRACLAQRGERHERRAWRAETC